MGQISVQINNRTMGGIRTTEYQNTIRVDNVQHNYLATLKILAHAEFPW